MREYLESNGNLRKYIYSDKATIDLSKDKIEVIFRDAFKNSEYVEHIILPYNLRCIDESAFLNCSNLKTIRLINPSYDEENGSLLIESNAFENCVSLDCVYLQAEQIILEKGSFLNCCKLRVVYLDSKNIEIRNDAFPDAHDLVICAPKNKKIIDYCRRNLIQFMGI